MKVKVVALPEIREYFKELIHILHEKNILVLKKTQLNM